MNFRKLNANEIDVRIAQITQYGVKLLLYKDARCDMNILDETVGAENWQRNHELINGNLFCNVGIYIPERKEWVWKQDVGTESYTEKEKGQASDSFKRACFNFGIGRELYTAPKIKFDNSDCNIKDGKCYDTFSVKAIDYEGNTISRLWIENDKTNKSFKYGYGKEPEAITQENVNDMISEQEYYELQTLIAQYNACNEQPLNHEKMLKHFNVSSFMTLTNAQYQAFIKQLKANIK